MPKALGLVETRGLVAAIEAADAMVKAANVTLVGKERTDPALITVKIVGETAAVRSAIDAGSSAAKRVGVLVSTHIIPQPDNQMTTLLPEIKESSDKKLRRAEKVVPVQKKETVTPVQKKESAAPVRKTPVKREKPKSEKTDEGKVVEEEVKITSAVSDTISRLREEALGTGVKKKKETRSTKAAQGKREKLKMEELELLNVHQLRRFARSTEGFPIYGREISKANRKQLLDHFKRLISK
jgi:ethanolamine utilization protein EutM